MNVLPQTHTKTSRILLKIAWSALALFAPEIVLWRAISQRFVAQKVCEKINAIFAHQPDREINLSSDATLVNEVGQDAPPIDNDNDVNVPVIKMSDQQKDKSWGLAHGFFVVMGGLQVKLKREDQWILDGRSTITPTGALFLAKLDLLPDIPEETVNARSKADELVKGLACIQAVYILVEIIARWATALPVTLLELNTLAHVVCALAMYCLWWKKPQDVNEPFEVPVPRHVAIFMLLRTSEFNGFWCAYSPQNEESPQKGEPIIGGTLITDNLPPHIVNAIPPNNSGVQIVGKVNKTISIFEINGARRKGGIVMLLPGQALRDIPFTPQNGPWHLTAADIERLKLLTKIKLLPDYYDSEDWRLRSAAGCNYDHQLVKEASNLSDSGTGAILSDSDAGAISLVSQKITLMLFCILGLLYGGIHATSWNTHFPSVVERTLWHVAACVVAGGGFALCTLGYAFSNAFLVRKTPKWYHKLMDFCVNVLGVLAGLVFVVVATSIVLSRIYLVVESFISIRSLPYGAYKVVNWTTFFPHF